MPEQRHSGATVAETPSLRSTIVDFFYPFPNVTVYQYIKWFQGTSGTLSAADLDCLACDVISSDDFNPKDLRNFSTAWEMKQLDEYGSTDVPFTADDDWKKGLVMIHVPNMNHKYASESASPQFLVSGILYCPLLEVIKAACQSSKSEAYHWVPFKLIHQTPLVYLWAYTDIYNSKSMLEEDAKIRAKGRHPDDNPDTEITILAMLFWSDSTHLTNFGTASVWLIYLYFGNLSKYACGRPNACAAHHLAYIPSVSLGPDLYAHWQDCLTPPSSPTLSKTFTKRLIKLQQCLNFCISSRLNLCKRYGI